MVDMGVSEPDEVEFARVECQWLGIAFHGGKTLKHPAVHEKTAVGGLQQKARPGHVPGCGVEGQVDGHEVSSRGGSSLSSGWRRRKGPSSNHRADVWSR